MEKSKRIFRIGWDIDGVLAKSFESVLAVVNESLEAKMAVDDLTSWDAISKRVIEMTGNEKLASDLENTWYNPEVLRRSPPNTAMIDVFQRCRKSANTEQWAITTRRPCCTTATREWLGEHLPEIDWLTQLRIRPEGSKMRGNDFKAEEIKRIGIDIMVEDNTETATHLLTTVPKCKIVYITQPWNFSDNDPARAKLRVSNNDPNALYQRILSAYQEFMA